MKKNHFFWAMVLGLLAFTTGTHALTQQSFKDVPASHWAYSAVESGKASKLFEGYKDSTFQPNKPITRAEMAVLMERNNKMMEEKIQQMINQSPSTPLPSTTVNPKNQALLMYTNNDFQISYPKNYTFFEEGKGQTIVFENENKEVAYLMKATDLETIKREMGDSSLTDATIVKKAMEYYLDTKPVGTQTIAGFEAHKFNVLSYCDGPACTPKPFTTFIFYEKDSKKIYTLTFYESDKVELMKQVIESIKFKDLRFNPCATDKMTPFYSQKLQLSFCYPKEDFSVIENANKIEIQKYNTDIKKKETIKTLVKVDVDPINQFKEQIVMSFANPNPIGTTCKALKGEEFGSILYKEFDVYFINSSKGDLETFHECTKTNPLASSQFLFSKSQTDTLILMSSEQHPAFNEWNNAFQESLKLNE